MNAVVTEGGRENAAGACEHETATWGDTRCSTTAIFWGGGIDEQAAEYKGRALLTDGDCSVIKRRNEEATSVGVPILCIIGDTHHFAVFDRESCSTPGGYDHVKHDIAEGGRKIGGARGLMCKVKDYFAWWK